MQFDKELFVNNVYHRAREIKYRLYRLEEATGVSVGYLSRIFQKDNPTHITIDFAYRIAGELRIPLDVLVGADIGGMKEEINLLHSVVWELLDRTINNEVRWEVVARSNFTGPAPKGKNHQLHPLAQVRQGQLYYRSDYLFETDRFSATLVADCYRCSAQGGTFFLAKVRYNCFENNDGYELYLYSEGELQRIVQGVNLVQEGKQDYITLDHLYGEAYKQIMGVQKISPALRAKMKDFIKGKGSDEDGSSAKRGE